MEKSFLLLLPVVGVAALGYLSVRLDHVGQAAADGLMRFVVAVAVPAFLFRTLVRADLPADFGKVWGLLLSYYLGAVAVYLIGLAVARYAFRGGSAEQNALAAGASHANVVLLGIPAVFLVLGGEQSVPLALVVGVHALVLGVLASVVQQLRRRQARGLPGAFKDLLVEQVRSPILLAFVAGVIYARFDLPLSGPPDIVLRLLASAAVPCALFALGGVLVRYRVGGDLQQAMAASMLKLAVHPLLAWVLANQVFGLSGAWTWVVVMLAAMPFEAAADGRSRRAVTGAEAAGSTVALSSLLAVFSVWVLIYIIVAG
jgi:predicted permease